MPKQEFDVLIIGSGHSGGMAASVLTQKGISCLMLDAGPEVDLTKNRVSKAPWDLPYRGFNKPGRLPHVVQANEFNANQWVDEKEIPYTHDPANPYNWVRVRFVGGRSLFWGRQSFRLSDWEFNAAEIDGTGDSWPIRHADLDPFYSKTEASSASRAARKAKRISRTETFWMRITGRIRLRSKRLPISPPRAVFWFPKSAPRTVAMARRVR